MDVVAIYLVILVVAFFVLVVRPQRRRLAAHRALMASLEVGTEVITTGGIYGVVVAVADDVITLEVAPQVSLKVARGAIAHLVQPPGQQLGDESDSDSGTP